MKAGFQAFTDSGVFQIDGLTPNYQLVQRLEAVSQWITVDTVRNNKDIQYQGRYWVCSFTFSADRPLYAFSADSGVGVSLWDAMGSDDGRTYTVRFITEIQATVRLFVFSNVPATGSRYGLQVFSPNGTLIADAASPFYRVLDVIEERYLGDTGWAVIGSPNPPWYQRAYGRPVLISGLWPAHHIWGSSNSNQRLWDILEIGTVRISGDVVSWGTRVYNGGRTPNIAAFRECWHTRFMVLDGTGIV
ncbi:putative gp60 [Burkholderia pseudomallei MSHR983]|nr:putative gp22 [Burkholderia pseudomallei]KGU64935.1 putative gp60 [Burkholderia pseudomallei MSHR983]KGW79044.1 putative gp60 [Burkholderia pseudomallei MSHR2990]KGX68046.1 putative gp60 [Burkholderia pseudomallei TSV28]